MKKSFLFSLASLLIVFVFPEKCIIAENVIENSQINFRFYNSETGYAVFPDYFIIYDRISNTVVKNITKEDFNANPEISISLSSGQYRFLISTTDYLVFLSSFNVIENQKSQNKIFLDPLIKNPRLETKNIKAKHKTGYTLLIGYIADEISGMPLGGVKVTSSQASVISYSDNTGYYEIYIPSVSCNLNNYGNINFEKHGYSTVSHNYLELFSDDDIILNTKLRKGNNEIIIDQRKERRRINETIIENSGCEDCIKNSEENENKKFPDNKATAPYLSDAVVIPANIRVGRNCTGTNCTTVEYYTLQTYCKYVLPAEIYGCWGALPGGANSLQAFSVAVRSYGLWYVYNPLSSNYDICDNTYCQVFGSTQNSYCNSAVDNTSRYILVNSSGSIMRTEYSAENNNKGCGNGYSGTGTTWPCIYDPVCTDMTPNGHGRGLCQWGTVRWATGTKVSTSSPCNLGSAHGYGTKTWQGIVNHYYPSYILTQGGTAVINSVTPNPSIVKPCSTFAIQYNVTSTGSMSLMLGASIRKSGTTTWISDPAHDVKLNITSGTNNYNRSFTVPCSSSLGLYDLLAALWYDKNNNNIIESSDLVVHSFPIMNNAINVQNQIGIKKISSEVPEAFNLYQNYPNPFNSVTNVKFDIPLDSRFRGNDNVVLRVFDLLGREVALLVNDNLQPGTYEVRFDAGNLPGGVYFYRLETADLTAVKRMILLK